MKALLVAAVLIATTASAARAADPKAEVGASLATATFGLGNSNDGSTFGIPSGGFGILQPGVYASFFVGRYVAIEPQIGLIWASSNGHSEHLVNFVGQVDYFLTGSSTNSPYIFGAAGVVDISGTSTTPKSVGGGAGYRIVAGDRLTFRIDGRVTHLTEGGGNMLAFGLTIGGVFR
jgi:opacity protein-like surface antigen